ncbi:MAG: DEAD/DEAH box helicase [Planctomycetaceae bacterium]|jgi:ATP-dependent RNA helicase DeaD|nr:DEAD/DEAH box helicase [Planctomycetaceae bacterium]
MNRKDAFSEKQESSDKKYSNEKRERYGDKKRNSQRDFRWDFVDDGRSLSTFDDDTSKVEPQERHHKKNKSVGKSQVTHTQTNPNTHTTSNADVKHNEAQTNETSTKSANTVKTAKRINKKYISRKYNLRASDVRTSEDKKRVAAFVGIDDDDDESLDLPSYGRTPLDTGIASRFDPEEDTIERSVAEQRKKRSEKAKQKVAASSDDSQTQREQHQSREPREQQRKQVASKGTDGAVVERGETRDAKQSAQTQSQRNPQQRNQPKPQQRKVEQESSEQDLPLPILSSVPSQIVHKPPMVWDPVRRIYVEVNQPKQQQQPQQKKQQDKSGNVGGSVPQKQRQTAVETQSPKQQSARNVTGKIGDVGKANESGTVTKSAKIDGSEKQTAKRKKHHKKSSKKTAEQGFDAAVEQNYGAAIFRDVDFIDEIDEVYTDDTLSNVTKHKKSKHSKTSNRKDEPRENREPRPSREQREPRVQTEQREQYKQPERREPRETRPLPPRASKPRVPQSITSDAASLDVEAESSGFAELGLSDTMLDSLKLARYIEPSPIQAGVIPSIMKGTDLMGQARTGTGKTAAFMIPLIELLEQAEPGNDPVVLVLVPTRELAVQVRDEAVKLSFGRNVRVTACYGGKPLAKQLLRMREGVDVVVGTPGRLLDLMNRGALSLNSLKWVVLDEADRMLDIGFRPDIEKILKRTPSERQTMLFSATLPAPVVKLAQRYMREPEVLDFSNTGVAVETIEQFYLTVDKDKKFDALALLLQEQKPHQAIVFCRTKRRADKVGRQLGGLFDSHATIHGDLAQASRDRVMADFRAGKIKILVATDVIGRGIDVSGISHIINYDIPEFCDDYVHRVGRTGRMGREGVAFTFVTAEEGAKLTRVEMRINKLLKRVDLPGFEAFSKPEDTGEPTEHEETKPVFGNRIRRIRRAL